MMLRTTILLLALLLWLQGAAQDYPRCTYSRFANGKVATAHCYDNDKRWGKARAYNQKGELIYEKELRTIGGHSSVHFSYYPSGAVKKAEYSSAPDAGIQWFRSTTEFAENGTVTHYHEDNHDSHTTLMAPYQPSVTKPEPTPKKTQETARCAEIFTSEIWCTNNTPYTVQVTATHNYQPAEVYTVILKPGATQKCGYLVLAEQFADPSGFFKLTAAPLTSRKPRRMIVLPTTQDPEQTSRSNRNYFFEVRRVI